MTDAPTTTARRTWRLVRTLALPWVVCGGLLGAFVGLTPPNVPPNPVVAEDPYVPGLSASLDFRNRPPGHPGELQFGWNGPVFSTSYPTSRHRTTGGSPPAFWRWCGTALKWGDGPAGLCWHGQIGLGWFLLPAAAWSAFNLWRWVRRTD